MPEDVIEVRAGEARDLEDVARIQAESPEASQWEPGDYLSHDFLVAITGEKVAGFLVARTLAPGESEILNLATARRWRRRGIAGSLVKHFISTHSGTIFLEVRESNKAALNLYKLLMFKEIWRREGYYSNPPEGAIVLKFYS